MTGAQVPKPNRAAIESSYGDVFVCLSPLPSFSAADGQADEGPLTITFRTLELGAKHQEGRGDLVVTRAMLDQMAKNFALRLSRGYKTPVVFGHPGIGEKTAAKAWEERIKAAAIGYLSRCEVKPDGLYVTATFGAKHAGRIRVEKESGHADFAYNSPSFTTRWVDEFGVDRGAALIDVGILNYPLQEGIGTLMSASAFAFAMGDANMDPEIKKLLDEMLARLEALEKAAKPAEGAAAAAGEVDASKPPPDAAKAEEMKASLSALQNQVKQLSAQVADDVSKLREQVDASTKATEAQVAKAHGAECLRFLSTQLDEGKLAPARLPKDWKEKPAEAFAGLGFNSIATAEANFAAIPKNAVVNLAAAKSRGDATGSADGTTDMWQRSSRREELTKRFEGDEKKAKAYYFSTLCMTAPVDDEDDDDGDEA